MAWWRISASRAASRSRDSTSLQDDGVCRCCASWMTGLAQRPLRSTDHVAIVLATPQRPASSSSRLTSRELSAPNEKLPEVRPEARVAALPAGDAEGIHRPTARAQDPLHHRPRVNRLTHSGAPQPSAAVRSRPSSTRSLRPRRRELIPHRWSAGQLVHATWAHRQVAVT
jgi:hypothetical protein